MRNEEKFKQGLNSKLGEEHFPFDESNWAGAEALLDADKKGGKGFYYLIPLLLILGGISAYWMWPQGKANLGKEKILAVAHALPEILDKRENVNANIPLEKNIVGARMLQSQQAELPVVQKPSASMGSLKNEAIVKPMHINEVTSPKIEVVLMDNGVDNVINQSDASLKNEINVLPPIPNGPQLGGSELLAVPVVREQVLPAVVLTPTFTNVNQESVVVVVEKAEALPELALILPEKKENPSSLLVQQEVKVPLAEIKENKQELLSSLQNNSISTLPDTSKAKAVAEEIITPTVFPSATTFLFLELGAGYNLGYQNPSVKDGNGFNPHFGLQLMSVINKNYSFSFGIQYQSLGHLNYSRHISKVTRYGLGEDSYVTVITPSTAHYLYLPLRFNYQMKEKNVFSLGCNIGYLMNVSSKVETYNEHFNYVDNYKTYNTGGYTEGFAMFESQLALAYRRKLYRDIWLRSELYVGLTDMKNNTFFNSTVFERNSGIKVSLMYQLFKK